jgi:hypothetical protein
MNDFPLLRALLFTGLMLICKFASAQNDYLVTVTGDTVLGEIRPFFFGVEKKVQVKNKDGKETYSILKTKYYRLDDAFYYPVKGPTGYVFMRLVKPGYLSVYRFQTQNSTIYNGTYLLKADGSGIELPNLGFKKQMAEFLDDCEDLKSQISEGKLKKGDLDKIVDEYNACVQQRTVEVRKGIEQHAEPGSSVNAWDALEETIQKGKDFEGKSTALEMITDVKDRIRRGEAVPNFIVDGLKNTLAGNEALQDPLNKALKELGR